MRLSVNHVTTYSFDPASSGVRQSLRLWPSVFEGQTTLSWTVSIEDATRGASFRDGAGDKIETATTLGPVETQTVAVSGEVETANLNGVLRGHRERVHPLVYLRETWPTRSDEALRTLAEGAASGATSDLDKAHRLAGAVQDAISYLPGQTGEDTTAAEALALGKGVCQDHAHAVIAGARCLDLPARYVVGYLHAEGDIAEASHAWAEIWVSDLGWVGFDAANGMSPDDHYIRVGSGFDAIDAALIRGVSLGHVSERLNVDVAVMDAQQ